MATTDREKLRRSRERIASPREELRLLRDFSRSPFDDIELPARVEEVAESVSENQLTYLRLADLLLLAEMVVHADRSGHEGLVIEAGTALGGSAITMAAAKSP